MKGDNIVEIAGAIPGEELQTLRTTRRLHVSLVSNTTNVEEPHSNTFSEST